MNLEAMAKGGHEAHEPGGGWGLPAPGPWFLHLPWHPGNAVQAAGVVLAAVPLPPFASAVKQDFAQNRERARMSLMDLLFRHFSQSASRAFPPEIRLAHDLWGKPFLLGPSPFLPAISFSYAPDCLWGALGHPGVHLGLDVAEAAEFPPSYPVHRLGKAEEWREMAGLAPGGPGEAAALLWSAKEAAVKALGCGYHGIGPRQIDLLPQPGGLEPLLFLAHLDSSAKPRFSPLAEVKVSVAVYRRKRFWLALGVASQALTG